MPRFNVTLIARLRDSTNDFGTHEFPEVEAATERDAVATAIRNNIDKLDFAGVLEVNAVKPSRAEILAGLASVATDKHGDSELRCMSHFLHDVAIDENGSDSDTRILLDSSCDSMIEVLELFKEYLNGKGGVWEGKVKEAAKSKKER